MSAEKAILTFGTIFACVGATLAAEYHDVLYRDTSTDKGRGLGYNVDKDKKIQEFRAQYAKKRKEAE